MSFLRCFLLELQGSGHDMDGQWVQARTPLPVGGAPGSAHPVSATGLVREKLMQPETWGGPLQAEPPLSGWGPGMGTWGPYPKCP